MQQLDTLAKRLLLILDNSAAEQSFTQVMEKARLKHGKPYRDDKGVEAFRTLVRTKFCLELSSKGGGTQYLITALGKSCAIRLKTEAKHAEQRIALHKQSLEAIRRAKEMIKAHEPNVIPDDLYAATVQAAHVTRKSSSGTQLQL